MKTVIIKQSNKAIMAKFFTSLFFFSLLSFTVIGQTTHTVINTDNQGAGSLRQAITDAVAGDIIHFNIPGTGPHNILATSTYGINKSLTIDATTQPGYAAGAPSIAINGIDNWTNIFHLTGASDVTIDGIDMTSNLSTCGQTKQGIGIFVQNSGTVHIQNCKFGHRRLGLNLFNTGSCFITNNDFRDSGHNGIRSSIRIIGAGPILAQGNLWGGCSNSMIGAEAALTDIYIGTDVNHPMDHKIIIQPGEGFEAMQTGLVFGTNVVIENVLFKKAETAGSITALSFTEGSVSGSTFEGFNYGLNLNGVGPVSVECSEFIDNSRGINNASDDLSVGNSFFMNNSVAIFNSDANEVAAENNYFDGGATAGDFSGAVDYEPSLSGAPACAGSTPTPVPTMGEWALIIFGLIIMSLGVVTVRRREELTNIQAA